MFHFWGGGAGGQAQFGKSLHFEFFFEGFPYTAFTYTPEKIWG
jgi:hypothetical protein